MTPLDEWFVSSILPHEAALQRYLRRLCRNTSEIPDICQEVYVRIYENAAHRKPASPKSFMFTTARNLIIDKARRERVVSIEYTEDSATLDVLTDEQSPEERCGAAEELRQLCRAFDRLSDHFREVIWFRRIEGLSQAEAAHRLGINEGTLESRLNRALAAFSRELAEAPEHEDLSEDRNEKIAQPGGGA